MHETIGDLVIGTLKASGVRRIYGIPGDSINGFTDALRRDGGITWEHVRHEEAAAFAAAGEAAVTGELAVCAGSCGPGNMHLVNGLYDAAASRVPVLAIAGHIPLAEVGGSYFQETHPQELFRECAVYCELVSVPEQLPRVLEIAMRFAVQRSGVAVVVIPEEILVHKPVGRTEPAAIRAGRSIVVPAPEELDAAARVLNDADRVTIFAGAGCQGAHTELMAAAEALRAPIVHTLRGKEHVEYDNPYDVGMTGLLGFESGYRAMERCDALLMLGTDFPYRPFYPDGVQVVQVDVRGEHLGRRVPVDVGLVGTVKDTLKALLPRLTTEHEPKHLEQMQEHYRRARASFDAAAREGGRPGAIHPQQVVSTLSDAASDDAVFVSDTGTSAVWAARYLRMNGRRRLLGSFVHGTMADSIGLAMGVQASHPGRQVVTITGDGAFAMLMGELLTLRQQHLPINVVVLNNGALAFVELEMLAGGIVTWGTDLDNPSFAEIARAVGLHGVRIEEASQLEDGMREALAHDGASVIEVMVERRTLSIPPNITGDQAKGFALWATRSVLSGRGDDVLQVAKANLRDLVGG